MTELHELLGRELDPIDDVRRRFEDFYTDPYFDPQNGDLMSDEYERVIDLTTQPSRLDSNQYGRLEKSIKWLNTNYELIQSRLGGSSLLGAYNQVAQQINAINANDPYCWEVPAILRGNEVTK